MSVPVFVPRRADGGWRDEVWNYLKVMYWSRISGFRVLEGVHEDGPFNRSMAINQAAAQRFWDDVAVVADADSFVPERKLIEACEVARDSGKLVCPFTFVLQLGESFTRSLIAGPVTEIKYFDAEHVRTKPIETQSNTLVVPRALWDEIGGFDERFVGWGGEDNAFWRAAEIRRGGQVIRLPGAVFHLWHEPASDRNTRMQDPQYLSNLGLANKYMRCRDKNDLRAVRYGRA